MTRAPRRKGSAAFLQKRRETDARERRASHFNRPPFWIRIAIAKTRILIWRGLQEAEIGIPRLSIVLSRSLARTGVRLSYAAIFSSA
jgi:hypothetical protein